ncbi:MAG: hypothetical protein GY940_01295, partial [bacterium]|nr:hypothetical protein [bacterium]
MKSFPPALKSSRDKPLEQLVIPYSETNLRKIAVMSKVHSAFLQPVISFNHNSFEINLWTETFKPSPPGALESLDTRSIEGLFLQWGALYRTSVSLGWDFIDFSRFCILPGPVIRFPLLLPRPPQSPAAVNATGIRDILDAFQRNPKFKNLTPSNHPDFFSRLAPNTVFDETIAYIYRYDDFASVILNSYPLSPLSLPPLKNGGNIKINISTPGMVQKEVVKGHIINHYQSRGVFFEALENGPDSLHNLIARLFSHSKGRQPGDFATVIDQMVLFLQQSPFNSVVFMVDRVITKEDAEFVNFLLDASGITGIILICFDVPPGLVDFHLQLNETPVNLVKDHLRFEHEENPTPPPLPDTHDDGSPGSRLHRLLKSGRTGELKDTLIAFQQSPTGFDMDYPDTGAALAEHFPLLAEDSQLVELMAGALVEGNDTESARMLIRQYRQGRPDSPLSIVLKLILARILHLEKDHRRMAELLEEVESDTHGEIPGNVSDQFHYLKCVRCERVSDLEGAEYHRGQIRGDLYLNRAAIPLCDRYIYQGDYREAGKVLTPAVKCFHRLGYTRDELDAAGYQAKILREKGAFKKAEQLYKNIFIRSQIKNYPLLSATFCIDLGTLYYFWNRFNEAGTWYRRGLRIFKKQGNRNGINLAEFNLMEIRKISGNWTDTKRHLESIVKYDAEAQSNVALGTDYFNIGHLEYLKHRFERVTEFLKTSIFFFEKNNNLTRIVDAEMLRVRVELVKGSETIDLKKLKESAEGISLNRDQKASLSLLEMAIRQPRKPRSADLAKIAASIQSKTIQFEFTAAVINRHRSTKLLEQLKSLSIGLSKEEKNYYYYEYYYIYYRFFWDRDTIDEPEKERFNDMYYFFLKNRRRMAKVIIRYKELLDERESAYDVFKSARLVRDSFRWKLPEDFFNTLLGELKKAAPVQLVRLVVHDRGDRQEQSGDKRRRNRDTRSRDKEQWNPVFDFTHSVTGAQTFDLLTREMITLAIAFPRHLNLASPEIKREFHSKEKAFYLFVNTKVILWKISDTLSGALLLAFKDPEYSRYDFFERHCGLFLKFGPLIQRYYEMDYELNQKLGFIIGESPVMETVKQEILKIGKVDFPVLVQGESGSGKELVAKGIHLLSPRSHKPFVAV